MHLLDEDAVRHLSNAFSIWMHLAWSVRKRQFQWLNAKNLNGDKFDEEEVVLAELLLLCPQKSSFAAFFLSKFLNLFLCKCLGIELRVSRTGRRYLGKRELRGYQWSVSEKSYRMSCEYTEWDHAPLWICETFCQYCISIPTSTHLSEEKNRHLL